MPDLRAIDAIGSRASCPPMSQALDHARGFTREERNAYERDGIVAIRGAIDPRIAQAMADQLWQALETKHGVRRDKQNLQTGANPYGLGPIARSGALAAEPSPRIAAMLDELLGPGWTRPPSGRLPLVSVQTTDAPWDVPHASWHLDLPASAGAPQVARLFLILAPLAPRGGGTLVAAGSHRLLTQHARRAGAPVKSADATRHLRASHPWFADLATAGAPDRVRRFMETETIVDGVPVRVLEMTGELGDAFLMHPMTVHAAAPNTLPAPRMMLTQWIHAAGFAGR